MTDSSGPPHIPAVIGEIDHDHCRPRRRGTFSPQSAQRTQRLPHRVDVRRRYAATIGAPRRSQDSRSSTHGPRNTYSPRTHEVTRAEAVTRAVRRGRPATQAGCSGAVRTNERRREPFASLVCLATPDSAAKRHRVDRCCSLCVLCALCGENQGQTGFGSRAYD